MSRSEQRARRIKLAIEGTPVDLSEARIRTKAALKARSRYADEDDVIPVSFTRPVGVEPKLFGYPDCPRPIATFRATPKFDVDVYDADKLWEAIQRWIAAMD